MSFHTAINALTFTCPKCKRDTDKTFEWARCNNKFRCQCGTVTSYDMRDAAGLQGAPSTFSSKFETSGFNFTRR